MNPLVSMIVPVYNGEKVIERCLCSLKGQTYNNIEIIVINDGSKDHSKQIIDKYANLDKRIRAVHKENAGVSEARNQGLQLAQGEYVQFVDCDDWIPNHATESLVKAMLQDCQMVICDYNRVVEKNIVVRGHMFVDGIITKEEFALQMMRAPANYYYGVLWNKLFKMDIIREQSITFPNDRDWCEDFCFNLEYLKYVEHVYVLPEELYYYVFTKGSLTSSVTDVRKIFKMKTELYEYYKELYESLDLFQDNKMQVRRFYLDFARDKVKLVKVVRGVDVRHVKPREKFKNNFQRIKKATFHNRLKRKEK